MTLRTITFDPAEWQVVPKNPVPAMIESGANEVIAPLPTARAVYIAMLATAPEPPAQEPGTAAEIEALRTEVERLRADAERYRWLTENCLHSFSMTQDEPGEHTLVFEWRQSQLSEAGWSIHDAIDAAMEASNAG